MDPAVKVLYFGPAREITGTAEEEFVACDTASLCSRLIEKYPRIGAVPFVLALNRRILKEDSPLNDNDVVAVLPPFQGG